jgi:gliding motility-associated-like protein
MSLLRTLTLRLLFIALIVGGPFSSRAQITVYANQTAAALASAICGIGVVVLAPTLTCDGAANGTFVTGVTPPFSIPGGIVLATGKVVDTTSGIGIAHPASDFATASFTPSYSDADLATAAATTLGTNDACVLEFNFKATGDTVKFDYIFASEEYPEFDCTIYNDVFAFLISGGTTAAATSYPTPYNMARVPGTTIPVCINSVNCSSGASCAAMGPGSPFCAYYIDNAASTTLVYDGMTTMLRAIAPVSPCDTYHLKIGIADVGDAAYDSGVFLRQGSLTSTVPTSISAVGLSGLPYCVRGCAPGTFVFSIPAPLLTPYVVNYNIVGSATNGVDYATIGTSITIPAGSTSAVLTISPLVVPPAGPKVVTLEILVTNPCTGATTVGATASLTILDEFNFDIVTPDTSICLGQTVHIIATGDPLFPSLTYAWSPASTVTPVTSLITDATPTVTTTYTLTVTAPAVLGCAPQQKTITISLNPPPVLTVDSHLVKTCVGIPVNLHAYVTPASSVTYNWTPPTDLSNSTVWNPTVTPSVAGDVTYTVTVVLIANPACVNFDTIHVHTLGDFTLQNSDTAICLGESVQTRILGSNEFSWAWAPAAFVVPPTGMTPVITPTTSGIYTVTSTYAACPPYVHSFYIEVDTAAHPRTLVDTICVGMTYTADFTVPGSTGTGSGYYSYKWTPATYIANDTLPAQTIAPTVAGSLNYTVTTTPHAQTCAVNNYVKLEVLPNVISVLPEDTAICIGGAVQIRASGGHSLFTYQWLPTAGIPVSNVFAPVIMPDTSSYYVVTAHFHLCPDIRDTMFIDVQPNPVVELGDDRTVCSYDSLHIHAGVNPMWYTHYRYTWTPSGYLDNDSASTVVFHGDSTTIKVVVTTPAGCTGEDTVKVIVFPGDFASLYPAAKNFCPHDTFTLQPTGGLTYQWTPPYYLSNPNGPAPVISPITSQNYMAVATSIHGCKDTLSFSAIVHAGAVIYLEDSVTIYPGESYQISPQSNCTSFTWFPAAGLSSPYVSNPLTTTEMGTRYIVQGSTEWGCTTRDTIIVNVDPDGILAIPNAFTPGGSVNNEFKIIKRGLATLNYFRIFNRWGNLVFETKDIDKGWNGEFNGVPQPFGVYVYQVEAFLPA